jgi:hypothetical protein
MAWRRHQKENIEIVSATASINGGDGENIEMAKMIMAGGKR